MKARFQNIHKGNLLGFEMDLRVDIDDNKGIMPKVSNTFDVDFQII